MFIRFCGILLLLSASVAHAKGPEINVGEMYNFFTPGKSLQAKKIHNSGGDTAFVKITVNEMVRDAAGRFSELPSVAEGAGGHENTLIASPSRLIIGAGSTQSVRLVFSGQAAKERYYRVRYIPVTPELADGFSLSEGQLKKAKKELAAGISVLAGYGTMVFVPPANARFDTRINESADSFTLSNHGNATVVVDRFVACPASGQKCAPATRLHLFPGQSSSVFARSAGEKYRFELVEGGKVTKKSL